MQLSELNQAVANAQRDVEYQQSFIDTLTAKLKNGDTTIRVMADNVWSEVNLEQFIALQTDKLKSYTTYAETLSGIENQLQETLSSSLTSTSQAAQ